MFSSAINRFGALAVCLMVIATTAPTKADAPTDQQVNQVRAFLEFALGFPLSAKTLNSVRAGLASDFSTDPSGSEATLKDMNTVMAFVHSQPASAGALLRSLLEPQLVAAWQADTSDSAGTSRVLVRQWRKHNHIIANGRPPLRREVVDSFIEMYEFIAKQTGKPVPAAIANHASFTSRVAKQYAVASPDSQMQFNKVQTLWLALQTMWANATSSQRAAIRQQWTSPAAAGSTNESAAGSNASAQSGFSGQITQEERYNEKLFVDENAQVMMATWTNPFSP